MRSSKITVYFFTLIFGTLLGIVFGKGLAYYLARLSIDYYIIPSEYVKWGGRFGFLSGSSIAACHMLSKQAKGALKAIVANVIVFASLALIICLSSVIARLLFTHEIWTPTHWQMLNPTRYAMLSTALWAKNYCSLPCLSIVLIWLFKTIK